MTDRVITRESFGNPNPWHYHCSPDRPDQLKHCAPDTKIEIECGDGKVVRINARRFLAWEKVSSWRFVEPEALHSPFQKTLDPSVEEELLKKLATKLEQAKQQVDASLADVPKMVKVRKEEQKFAMPEPLTPLPKVAEARKAVPLATGVIDYFPDALAAVAVVSKVGGEQHHPGEPLHWDRSKSTDEADALMRHFLERGTTDTDGLLHSAKVAWRALALLQKEIEASRSPQPARL